MNTSKHTWMLGTYGERVAAVCKITDFNALFDIMCSDPIRETRLAAAYMLLLDESREIRTPDVYQYAEEIFSPHVDIIPMPFFQSNYYKKSFANRRADSVPFVAKNRELLRIMASLENETIVVFQAAYYLGFADLQYAYEHTHFKNKGIKSILKKKMEYGEYNLPQRNPVIIGRPKTISPGLPPQTIPDYKWQLDDFIARFKEAFDAKHISDMNENDITLAVYAMKENEDLELMRILQNLFLQPDFRHKSFLKTYHNTLVCAELEDDGNGYHRNTGHLRLPVEMEAYDLTYFEQQKELLRKDSLLRLEKRISKKDGWGEFGH